MNKKERTLYFILLVFFFSLYAPAQINWLYNVLMWVIFVYSLFFNSFTEKWQLLKQRKEMLLLALFFLFNCASALFSDNLTKGISWVGIRISVFVFPVSLGSLYISSVLKDRIIYAFCIATTCAALLCLLWGFGRWLPAHDWSLLYNDNLSEITDQQSVYLAMLVNLAIFGFVYLLSKKSFSLNRYYVLTVMLLLLVVHFLLASRIAIGILYSSVLLFALYHIIRKKKIWQGAVLAAGIVVAGFLLVNFFPKTVNRFRELGYTGFKYSNMGKESHFNVPVTADQWNGANIRIAVWQCAWTVTKHHMFFGTGLGDKMDELKKQYAKNGFLFGVLTNRNVHNNHLDVWMSLGLVAFIIYLGGFFVLPLINGAKQADWYGIIIVLAFAISLFTETYMDRTMGNTVLAFFISFLAACRATGKKI